MDGALEKMPVLPEWQDDAFLKRSVSRLCRALQAAPAPSPGDVQPDGAAWSRLAYDELLAGQLALALVRAHQRRQPGRGSRRRDVARRSSPPCPIR
jgi:ATP-dependent DNA helicase RecG